MSLKNFINHAKQTAECSAVFIFMLMFKDKPVISDQHGALVMALIPFIYAISLNPHWIHLSFLISWLFLYFSTYPFFSLFSKKPTARNKKWAAIYFIGSLIFALPVLYFNPKILWFIPALLPFGFIQIYYAKKRDERNLFNDIAAIFTFGIVGMSAYFVSTNQLNWAILIHPTLFFIANTLYIKSVLRERKNPRYYELSGLSHLLFACFYFSQPLIFAVYLLAFMRAMILPHYSLKVKQIGLLEFPVSFCFLLALIFS